MTDLDWDDPKLLLPRTLSEAKRRRTRTYFTGVPCPRGHVSERYTGSALCADCVREEDA